MQEYQFEDFNKVLSYNTELWSRFMTACENGIRVAKQAGRGNQELGQSLDLIRAINSYRAYPSPEDLFQAYPELVPQGDYVYMLWRHFDGMDGEELSNLAIEMIHEVCTCSELLS